jgi:hypothetical protein
MVEKIISHINNNLKELNIFSSLFGLCEIISKDKKSFPAFYCNNEYKQVSDFDKQNGTAYHRLIGSIKISESESELDGCTTYAERAYPMRLVVCVKKSVYKNNDAYIDMDIAENIGSVISFQNNKQLRNELNASVVSVLVKSINTNRDQIFRDEYKGYEMFIDYNYSYISIDYEVKISGDLSCYLNQGCR